MTKRTDHALHSVGIRGAAIEQDYAADAAHRLNAAPDPSPTPREPSARHTGATRLAAAAAVASLCSSSCSPYNGLAAGSQTSERAGWSRGPSCLTVASRAAAKRITAT